MAEQAQVVTMTVAAKAAGLITARQGVEKIASIYGSDNVEAVLEALETEAAERQKAAMEQAKAMGVPGNGPLKPPQANGPKGEDK